MGELDQAGALKSHFVYATQGHSPDYMISGGVNYKFIKDHLGSVKLVANSADGTVAQRIDYDEFGVVLTDSNPGFQPFGFAGGIYDSDSGLVRFGARDYDPVIGRWTAKDPIGLNGGINLYSYILGDPINGIDPRGTTIVSNIKLSAAVLNSDLYRLLDKLPIEIRLNYGNLDPGKRGRTSFEQNSTFESLKETGIDIKIDSFNIASDVAMGVKRAGKPVCENRTILHELSHARSLIIDLGLGGGSSSEYRSKIQGNIDHYFMDHGLEAGF